MRYSPKVPGSLNNLLHYSPLERILQNVTTEIGMPQSKSFPATVQTNGLLNDPNIHLTTMAFA